MLFADAQFLRGADHGFGLETADLCLLDLRQFPARFVTVIDHRAFADISDLEGLFETSLTDVMADVRGAAEDSVLTGAVIQLAERQFIGIRVLIDLADLSDNEFVLRPGEPFEFEAVLVIVGSFQTDQLDLIHFQTAHGQNTGDLLEREVHINIIFKP